MKKLLLSFLSISMALSVSAQWNRYLDEVFTDVNTTTNVEYARNFDFISGTPTPNVALKTAVYSPNGDTKDDRAAVIILHTGNFLPRYANQSVTGGATDSSIVESANLFAKRGYVAFTPSYRLGWDPANVDQTYGPDVRRGTLLNAVYRALNDVKSLVRFLKKSVAEDGNPYGIDPDKIIVYGHGSGGYLSLAYGSLDRIQELENEASDKWLSGTTVPGTAFVENQLYIDTSLVGDVDGFGGSLNQDNHAGYTNDVLACVNVGGALGDSAWMEVGEPPIISFHCPDDGYAPFDEGTVIVPTTNETVVDVVGSRWAVGQANALGNNDAFAANQPFNDPYTLAARAALESNHPLLGLDPDNYEGLFPFRRAPINFPFQESSPWDWWSQSAQIPEATLVLQIAFGLTEAEAQVQAQTIFNNAAAGAPTMSPVQGKAYLDSIQGYLAPRLRSLIEGDVSVEESEFVNSNTFVYPNPANDFLVVKTKEGIRITDVEFYDITGALVRTENGLNKFSHQINGVNNLPTGLYLVKVTTDQGITTRKVMLK